jgi:hypothetical protein
MSVDLCKITNSSGVAKSKDSVIGIGATATENVAYIYARLLFFYPPDSARDKKIAKVSRHHIDTQQ